MSFSICSVGCGAWAFEAHGPALAMYRMTHSDARLGGCADLDAARARRFKEAFGYSTVYSDMEAMLEAEHPDAVSLVVEPAATAALAVRIIERGIPVIMEKPPGLTARETRSIIAAAENAGVATRVAFNRRYMPIVARLMEMATADGAPPLEHIELDFHRVGRKDADFSTTAIHAVDLARFIARSDYASAKLSYQSGPGLDNVFLDCVFVSGGTARITLCPDAGLAMERVTAVARGVTFLVSLPGQDAGDARESLAQYRSDHDGRTGAPYPADDGSASKRNGFFDENAGFFDELQAGRRPSGGVEDALQSVEITECMRKKRPLYPAGHPARHPAAESP